MRQLIKRVLNWFFMRTISYRVVHNQGVANSDMEAWQSLKEHGFKPRTVVDVGAAVGKWTVQVLEIFPEAQFLMVDPLKENESALKALTGAHPNVRYWSGAVGSHDGELEFHVHGDQSSMFTSEWGKGVEIRRVPLRPLDALVQELGFGEIDGLKLDVQGAELEVLAGATETLKRCKVVQVEVMFRHVYERAPLAHDIIRFFAEQGFRIFDIASTFKRKDRALLQADLFFVKDDSLFTPEKWEL